MAMAMALKSIHLHDPGSRVLIKMDKYCTNLIGNSNQLKPEFCHACCVLLLHHHLPATKKYTVKGELLPVIHFNDGGRDDVQDVA